MPRLRLNVNLRLKESLRLNLTGAQKVRKRETRAEHKLLSDEVKAQTKEGRATQADKKKISKLILAVIKRQVRSQKLMYHR